MNNKNNILRCTVIFWDQNRGPKPWTKTNWSGQKIFEKCRTGPDQTISRNPGQTRARTKQSVKIWDRNGPGRTKVENLWRTSPRPTKMWKSGCPWILAQNRPFLSLSTCNFTQYWVNDQWKVIFYPGNKCYKSLRFRIWKCIFVVTWILSPDEQSTIQYD